MEKITKYNDVKQCSNCKYWMVDTYDFDDDSVESDYGFCRRYPPKNQEDDNNGFPVTHKETWCGEFTFHKK